MHLKPILTFAIAILVTLFIYDPSQAQPQRDDYNLFETEFHWLEIEDIGEALDDIRNNEFQGPFEIGYEFPYFGEIYEEFWISSNGFIGFGPSLNYQSFQNQELPDESFPNNIIALYWKDLNPEAFWAEGMIFSGMRDRKRIIQFQGVGEQNPNGNDPENTITMQVILERDGNIILQYLEIGEEFDLATGTIGLEDADGQEGTTFLYNNEGVEIANETAYLISDHGPGDFLVWDAGVSPSGQAQVEALEALGHSVVYRDRDDELPDVEVLQQYEGVFINLGNHGVNGRDYHVLTDAEGQIIAAYLESGNAVYLEGSDTFHRDDPTDAHPYFHIEGLADGGSLESPVVGLEDTFGEGFVFEEYQAANNNFVDHIAPVDGAIAVFTFREGEEEFIGMVALLSQTYRTIGCTFEFGGLVDGENGNKEELMDRMIEFFRAPPPDFPPPLNLSALAGDGEITLRWDHPRRAEGIMNREILDLQHHIARLTSRHNGEKPDLQLRELIIERRLELRGLIEREDQAPLRDELEGFNIFVDGEEFDFTNAHQYVVFDLENNRDYEFAVSAVYVDPDGESELAGPIIAVPTESISPDYEQDFEDFNGALSPSPGNDGWEWGEPEIGAHGGERAWGTIIDGQYPANAEFYLQLPRIDLSDVEGCYLSWFHYMDAENGWDGGQVQISAADGDRWELLVPFGGYPEDQIFALNATPGFTGTFDDWEEAVFNLTAWAGEEILIRMLFASDASINRNGWYIDDLSLEIPLFGSLDVEVEDGDRNPLEFVRVELVNFGVAVTNVRGHATFNNVPPGEYTVIASKPRYLEEQTQVNIAANELTVALMPLDIWDSVLTPTPAEIEIIDMQHDEILQRTFTLRNEGGQETSFELYMDYFVGGNRQQGAIDYEAEGEPWELVETINLTEMTGDQYFYGAEFVRNTDEDDPGPYNYRFIAGAGDFQSGECHFYIFNRNSDSLWVVLQRNGAFNGWGARDLTYDPFDDVLYGSTGATIYKFNPMAGRNRGSIIPDADLETYRALAYIPEEDAFWVGDWDDTWFKIDANGDVLDQNSQHGLAGVTGMAWNPSDPEGYYLYIHNQESENGGAAIYRYNPETRDIERVLETAAEDEGFAGGAFVTYLYDTHKFHLGVVIQGEDGDVLKIYELWDHSNWISVDPTSGDIDAFSEVEITVTFNSRNVYADSREAEIDIFDTNRGVDSDVFCTIDVEGGTGSISGTISTEDPDDDDADVADAFITLNGERGINPFFVEEGVYEYVYSDLIPGDYVVRVTELFGYLDWESEVISLEPAEDENVDVPIELIPEIVRTLTGTVTSIYDSPIAGAVISAIDPDVGGLIESTMTNDDGEYSLDLAPGIYDIVVHHDDWGSEREDEVDVNDEDAVVDFVLNDRRPVRSLRTDGYYDDRIELAWAPPGTDGEEVELAHHNGVLANGVYLINPNDLLAVKFSPEGVYDILNINIYIILRNGPLGGNDGWPDLRADRIFLYLFLEDPETGMPGELLEEILFHPGDRNGINGWENANVGNHRFLEGPFFVAWSQDPDDFGEDAVALDDEYNNEGTTFARFDNEWRRYDEIPGDLVMGAVIWSYFEGEEGDEFFNHNPRRVRAVGAMPDDIDAGSIVLMNPAFLPVIAPPLRLDWQSIYSLVRPPLRDDLTNYQIYDGDEALLGDEELLEADVLSWFHIFGSDGEDEIHNYSIAAIFTNPEGEDEEEIIGVSREAKANMMPVAPIGLDVEMDGLRFTLDWNAPAWNQDGTRCVDFVGTEVSINNEVVANVEGDETSWTGEIAEGEEGWYEITLIHYDEVPNRSRPFNATVPLGQSIVYNFEAFNPVPFTVDPFIGWSRFRNAPGEVHSGRYDWETNEFDENYLNDADWTMTTAAEYTVLSESARLEFYHFLESEIGHDGGQVLISVDGGDWILVEPEGGYPDQTVEAFRNEPGYSGRIVNWSLARFDLSAYQGSVIRIRFRFGSDESLNNYDGWHIDDMTFWGCEIPIYASVSGVINDQNDQPAVDINVSDGRQVVLTDDEGGYLLRNVLAGQRIITAYATGYNTIENQMDIEPDENVNLNISIVRAVVTADRDEFEFELGGNEHLAAELEITNQTNIDLPYWVRITSVPEHLRDMGGVRNVRSISGINPKRDDPWDTIFEINLTESIGHTRIMGAEFAGDNFYLTSADPIHGPRVQVLDWQGNLIDSFDQPIDVVGWGLRDLAFDGELLYAAQGEVIYGFTLDGELMVEIAGAPITVNRALAYDPPEDGFWTGEWDSPWYFVDREGGAEMMWEGHGLEGVYGFAYHQDDEDWMPLYILNIDEEGNTDIYRANPIEQELELVYQMNNAPTGCFITGSWDDDRWILGAITGTQTQQLTGLELNQRANWLRIVPALGVFEANEITEFSLEISVPMEAVEDDIYRGEIAFRIFNDNVLSIPVQASIIDGFRHFDAPQISEVIHTIEIESALYRGNTLPMGSEIAVVTPRGEIGGIMRWLNHVDQFPAYLGEGAFNEGEPLNFRVWISNNNNEYDAEFELLAGVDIFREGEFSTFALTILPSDTQVVELVNGWNLSSIFVRPLLFEVEDILGDINEREHLIIAKDGEGRFWWPAMNFNGLDDWNMLSAYQINVSEAESFTVIGENVPKDRPIPLQQGWNFVGYLLDHEVDSEIAFANIIDDIRIAKDGDGRFMVPDVNFFGLGDLQPGRGYKLKMHRNSELVYNDRENDDEVLNLVINDNLPSTGSDMSLLIESISGINLSENVVINAYVYGSNLLIGSAANESLPMGLVLHGDDPTVSSKIGAGEGDRIQLELIVSSARYDVDVQLIEGKLVYLTDEFVRLSISAVSPTIPESFTISNIFPNPFNDAAVIRFSVPTEMNVNIVVRDLFGREIHRNLSIKYIAGWHEITISSTGWSSGIYFMDLQAEGKIFRRKLVLLK